MKPNNFNDMEHCNKYYLVKASNFERRRASHPPTSYEEQRSHHIEHSYKEFWRELTIPSEKVFNTAAKFRRRLSQR